MAAPVPAPLRALAERVFPAAARRSPQAAFVAGCGPLTALLGLGWALVQPARITFLHPHDAGGFWYLLGEPPLLVILVGLLFHAFVGLPLVRDLERVRAERAGGGAATPPGAGPGAGARPGEEA